MIREALRVGLLGTLALISKIGDAQDPFPYIILNGPQKVDLSSPIIVGLEGVRDSRGSEYPWHLIADACLSASDQIRFQALKQSVGDKIFRIHARMIAGNWRGLIELADSIPSDLVEEWSPIWLRIQLARFHGHWFEGEHAAAATVFLRFLMAPEELAGRILADYPKSRITPESFQTGQVNELLPLFFGKDRCQAMVASETSFWQQSAKGRPSKSQMYVIALLIASEQFAAADKALSQWEIPANDGDTQKWQLILSAANEIAQKRFSTSALRIERELESLPNEFRACARYWLNVHRHQASKTELDFRHAALAWLRLGFEAQAVNRELSAAAIFQAFRIARDQGWDEEAGVLANQLNVEYAESYFGQEFRREFFQPSLSRR